MSRAREPRPRFLTHRQLCCRRQTGRFPGFEAASDGADVFIAHFLQAFRGKRGTSKAFGAAMANDNCVREEEHFLCGID
jgi:hypothetical protein